MCTSACQPLLNDDSDLQRSRPPLQRPQHLRRLQRRFVSRPRITRTTYRQKLIPGPKIRITVWDSTNKANSKMLGRLEYPGATYTHQGWWTERNWHQFVLLNDELDEVEGVVADGVPITHIVDLTDLRNPKWTGTFKSTDHKAVDHNLYITDGVMFQSNYGAGVWVTDVRSISKYPDGSRVKHIAFFDVHPEDDVRTPKSLFYLYLMLTPPNRRLVEVSISSDLGAISSFPRDSLWPTPLSAALTP